MAQPAEHLDRRRYPRLRAPIFFKSPRFRISRRLVVDVSLGGVRIYSDRAFKVDERLDIELFLPGGTTIRCLARVAWISALPENAPAAYDVGLQLIGIPAGDLQKLEHVLETAGTTSELVDVSQAAAMAGSHTTS